MNKIFVYETLLDKKIIKKIIGREVILIPLKIKGLKEISSDLSTTKKNYHTLVKVKESFANGAVFNVNNNELQKLKDWENNYKLIKLNFKSGIKIHTFILKKNLIENELNDFK